MSRKQDWDGHMPPYIVDTFEYRGAFCIVNKPHQWRRKYESHPDPIMRMLAAEGESHNGYVVANMPPLKGKDGPEGYDYATERVAVHGGWTYCASVGERTMLGFDGQHKDIITEERAVQELKRAIDGLIAAGIMAEVEVRS